MHASFWAVLKFAYRSRRVREAERMDLPGLAPEERMQALKGLHRLSRWPGQRGPILRGLAAMLGRPQSRTRRLIEVGAGSGHLSSWLAPRLKDLGHTVELLATDREAAEGVLSLDALSRDLPEADIYFSNLMLHHLEDADVKMMLSRQAAVSRVGLVHFDLHRHWAHYYGAWFFLRTARMPGIVLQDGSLSIQQGYTRAELMDLAEGASLSVRIDWNFPFRWMLSWRRR